MTFGSRASVTVIATTLGALLPAAAAETITLDAAMALAYQNHPRLEAERATLRATDEDVARALAGWRPSAQVTSGYGWQHNELSPRLTLPIPEGHPRDVTVTLSQPLFNGRAFPETRQAKATVRAGRAQLTSIEQRVLLDAVTAYMDVVTDQTAVEIRRQNIALLEEQRRATELRVTAGDLTRTDLNQVQARLASANADLSLTLAKLAASRSAFLRAIGRQAEGLDATPKLPELPPNEETALERARQNNPDLLSAREQAEAADASVGVADSQFLPYFSLQGQYRKAQDMLSVGLQSESLSLMAQLRVPLYQGGAEYAGVRKAQELRNRAALLINATERELRETLHSAWEQVTAVRNSMALYENQIQANEEAYRGVQEQARVGERTVIEVLNAAQELLTSRLSLAQTRRELYLWTFRLQQSVGDLTAVSLNLPVQTYNPQQHYDDHATSWLSFRQ
jgi:outer membrane protein